jgi:hypothetical protein
MRFEIRLCVFRLTISINPFIGIDADYGVFADNGAFEISDFHWRIIL